MDSLRILFVAGTLSTAGSHAFAKTVDETAPEQTLCIRLYNQAHAPPGAINSATFEVTRLFKATGIRIRWERPQTEPPEDQDLDMSGPTLRNSDQRNYLVVRLVERTSATVFTGALGFALPFAQKGAHVTLFYDRIEVLARSCNLTPYVVLGHTMAHEIGHVLLRSSEHSAYGLLQPRWNQATWRLASAGLIRFLPEQAAAIREAVRTLTTPHADKVNYTHNNVLGSANGDSPHIMFPSGRSAAVGAGR